MPRLLTYVGTKNSAGDNELIAAPGSKFRICPVLLYAQNLTTTTQTPYFYDGPQADGRPILPNLQQNQESGVIANCVFHCEHDQVWQIKLTENKPLVANLTNSQNVLFCVWYYIESM